MQRWHIPELGLGFYRRAVLPDYRLPMVQHISEK